MRLGSRAPILTLFLLAVCPLAAQRSADPTRTRLAGFARLSAFSQDDLQALSFQAESGYREAQYWLGSIYAQGRLVEKDLVQAESWLLKSANQNYTAAQRALGMIYSYRDPDKSETWFQRAAEQRDSEAQFWLGVGYEEGKFGATNFKEALKWLQNAAVQGHPDAQVNLAQMYEDGEGVKQDYIVAAKWYRKAAERVPNLGGAGQGRNNLGLLYLQGLGVPKDYVKAYMWFAVDRVENNNNLKEVQSRMTPAEIFQGQRMAEQWRRQHRSP